MLQEEVVSRVLSTIWVEIKLVRHTQDHTGYINTLLETAGL